MVQEDRTKCHFQNSFQDHCEQEIGLPMNREKRQMAIKQQPGHVMNYIRNEIWYRLSKHTNMLILMIILLSCLVALYRIQ